MLKPSYPDIGIHSGFQYLCPKSGQRFIHPVLSQLHTVVSKFCVANDIPFSNDEFDDNVCRNSPNIVCTEGIRGAGDLVHVVLNPISKVLDALVGTNTQGCAGCYKRQNDLNK